MPESVLLSHQTELEQSTIFMNGNRFSSQLLAPFKVCFRKFATYWITESNIWHAKLKFSFAKTTILFTFCCEHDSSSTGFYKACGYFGCYCNSERWKGFFIVVLVHSTVFLSLFDTDTRDSNLYVKEKAASLIEILDFFLHVDISFLSGFCAGLHVLSWSFNKWEHQRWRS